MAESRVPGRRQGGLPSERDFSGSDRTQLRSRESCRDRRIEDNASTASGLFLRQCSGQQPTLEVFDDGSADVVKVHDSPLVLGCMCFRTFHPLTQQQKKPHTTPGRMRAASIPTKLPEVKVFAS
jgi:hypothetical protein